MFSFFTKKHFLIDHLEGFIDIHNHVLPGIDDGAKNVDESIELLRAFGEFGVTDFICTPHIMENYYPNTSSTISKSLALLQNGLKLNNMDQQVHIAIAAEHMIDSGFEKLLDENGIMPLSKSYLLIEMSYLQPSLNFDSAVTKIKNKGYFPIFAHPERYAYLHGRQGEYQSIKKKGLMFQLNLLSLGDYYGGDVQKTAKGLLKNNLIDFAASDIHNRSQLESLKKINIEPKVLEYLLPVLQKTVYNFK